MRNYLHLKEWNIGSSAFISKHLRYFNLVSKHWIFELQIELKFDLIFWYSMQFYFNFSKGNYGLTYWLKWRIRFQILKWMIEDLKCQGFTRLSIFMQTLIHYFIKRGNAKRSKKHIVFSQISFIRTVLKNTKNIAVTPLIRPFFRQF